MKLNRLNFIDASFYHLGREGINSSLLIDRDLSKILKHQGYDSFGRRRGHNGPIVTHSLCEVRQGTAVIKMEMCDDYEVNDICKIYFSLNFICSLLSFFLLWLWLILSLLIYLIVNAESNSTQDVLSIFLDEAVSSIQEMKVGKLLLLDHVNSTVKHYHPASNFNDYAAASDVLPGAERNNFDGHFVDYIY
jgi:hypothetical protein